MNAPGVDVAWRQSGRSQGGRGARRRAAALCSAGTSISPSRPAGGAAPG